MASKSELRQTADTSGIATIIETPRALILELTRGNAGLDRDGSLVKFLASPRNTKSPNARLNTESKDFSACSHQRFKDFPLAETSELTSESETMTDDSAMDGFQDFACHQLYDLTSTDCADEKVHKERHNDNETKKITAAKNEVDVSEANPNKGNNKAYGADSCSSKTQSSPFSHKPFDSQKNDTLQDWTSPNVPEPEPFHLSEVMFMITRDVEAFKNM
jgi:hypothetical protein